MDKKCVIILGTAALLAIGGAVGGMGQANAYELERPLSPITSIEPALSPMSQQNAVRAAKNYLSIMPFSHDGLINQLTIGDGYSTADATSAVDSMTVDWNDQAAKAAKNYLDIMPFSHSGLIEQLTVGDGYTSSQAAYGVSAVGL